MQQKFCDILEAIVDNDFELFRNSLNEQEVFENGHAILDIAIRNNRVNMVEYTLKEFFISHKTKQQCLTIICQEPVCQEIKELIIDSVIDNRDIREDNGQSPLHVATKYSSLPIVKMLIAKGEDINAQDRLLYTPLHYAIEEHSIEIVTFLLNSGADTSIVDCNGRNPLMLSLHYNEDIVRLLLPFTSDMNIVANSGWSALMHAVSVSSKDIIYKIIENGGDVNIIADGYMPIHLAIDRDDIDLFVYLWNKTDPKVLIKEEEHEDFIKYMLKHKWFLPDRVKYFFQVLETPGLNLRQSSYVYLLISSLHEISEEETFLKINVRDIIKKLLEKGATLDICDLEGFVGISYRFNFAYKCELLNILLESNANFDDEYLMRLAVTNDPEFVTTLLSFCLRINPLDIFKFIMKVKRLDIPMLKLLKYVLLLCTPSLELRTKYASRMKTFDILDHDFICYVLLLGSLEYQLKKYINHQFTPHEKDLIKKLYKEMFELLEKDRTPSLKELSRDAVRKCLEGNFNSSREYLNVLDKLQVSTIIKDIIRCKVSVCTL